MVGFGGGVGDWVREEDGEVEVVREVEVGTVDVLNVVWVWEAMCGAFRLWVFVYRSV